MARRFTSLAVAALTLLALLCAGRAAEARVVATSATSFVAGPALASDGRLVVGERTLGGAVVAAAIDPTGARARQTLAIFPAAPYGSFTTLGLTGTGGVVGAQVDGRTLYGLRDGCAADGLVAVDVLSPAAPAPIPLLSPYGTDCPVSRLGSARLRASAGGVDRHGDDRAAERALPDHEATVGGQGRAGDEARRGCGDDARLGGAAGAEQRQQRERRDREGWEAACHAGFNRSRRPLLRRTPRRGRIGR